MRSKLAASHVHRNCCSYHLLRGGLLRSCDSTFSLLRRIFCFLSVLSTFHYAARASYNSNRFTCLSLRMNFISNYQNRRELKKLSGIDLYATLKPSAKFKRNWFASFEIIPLNFRLFNMCFVRKQKKSLTKNAVYSNIPKFMKIHV